MLLPLSTPQVVVYLFRGPGCVEDGNAWSLRSNTRGDETPGKSLEVPTRHVDDQRGIWKQRSGLHRCGLRIELQFVSRVVRRRKDQL